MTRNRHVRVVESSLEKLGRILSTKWGIRVVFKPNACYTNGNTIYLPVLPDNAPKDLLDAMQGYLDHEAAHVVFTDFTTLQPFKRFPKTMTMINALEDPRIEKKWCELWRGAAINLRNASTWALTKMTEEQEIIDPATGQPKMACTWDELSDFGKFVQTCLCLMGNNFDDNHWFIKKVVPPDVLQKARSVEDVLRAALVAKNTQELVPMAQDILKRLQEIDEETPEVPGDGEEDVDPNFPGGQSMSPQQQAMFKKNGKGITGVSDADVERDNELMDKAREIRRAAQDVKASAGDQYLVYTTEGDEFAKIKEGDRIQYRSFMNEAVSLVAPIKRKLSRALLSTNTSRWEGDKLRGKINPRSLHRVAIGTSKHVFRQMVEAEAFDTCVLMMIDHSGSMNGTPLDLAAKTSIIFGEVLSQINVPFSVLGFSTGCGSIGHTRFEKAQPAEQEMYVRWGNLWIGQYKSFDESWANTAHRLINMTDNNRDNTYDGESLRYGAQLLLARPERRKIMFWLNDGEPCPNGSDDRAAHVRYTEDCAAEVEKMVELTAIGIRTNAVKKFYKNSVVINSLSDLPKVCFSELDTLLRRGKRSSEKR